jgi:galactonate dehydratase
VKVAKVEQFFPRNRMRLVKVTTDNGLVGWGESTLEGRPQSTCAAVDEMADYLVGKDPLRIEHHWQHIYRSSFFRGGSVVMSALSGIDQALWDIAGKHYGVPVYKLLGGGAVRDRVRVYAHWGIRDDSDEGLQSARERLDELLKHGYTAFKSGPGGKWRAHEPPAVIDAFVKKAYMMREWVGDEIELCFDFHGKMTPGLAVEICQELKGMRPMFVEEPVPQENVAALKLVSEKVSFPIATGERLLSRWEFREVLEMGAVSYIQPDGSHAGGISELLRIANMVVPNFLVQEQIGPKHLFDVLSSAWEVEEGHIVLPDKPGLGFEVDEKEVAKQTTYVEELGGEHYYESDGSVADW